MQLFWIEQTESSVPTDTAWLSPVELSRASALHIAKRRADWVLGRWTAKSAVISYLGLPSKLRDFAAVEIRASTSGAPEVFWHDKGIPVSISLSHSNGKAVCAIGPDDASFGCDVERVEPRNAIFIVDYFTAEEQQFVKQVPEQHRERVVTLIWSAKESALKALRAGLRLDTRSVAVRINDDLIGCVVCNGDNNEWSSIAVCGPDCEAFFGWCHCSGEFVKTLVSAMPVLTPTSLRPLTFEEPAERRLISKSLSSRPLPTNFMEHRKEA